MPRLLLYRPRAFCWTWSLLLLFLALSLPTRAEVLISEFMALNNTNFADVDKQFSDWIELYNSGADAVDLGGWHLTDDAADLAKWTLPTTNLPAGGYLVVFASGKDRTNAGTQLHTSFKLDGGGEYLALVQPDGITVASEYAPQYPVQYPDVSYGLNVETGDQLFFTHPTPGATNDISSAGIVDPPGFSLPAGIYTNNAIIVALSSSSPTAMIRYTLNGTVPATNSAIYSSPLTLTSAGIIRARCFEPGKQPSPTASRHYTLLASDLLAFSSNLPLLIVNTFGAGISESVFARANATFLDTVGGRCSLTGPIDNDGLGGIKLRGSSSLGFPKHSYSFETRDEKDEARNAALIGFPEDNDWVLYAPYTDKSMMRDFLAYELHGKMGHYSVRTRFIEVFVHSTSGKVAMRDYVGVYVLEEKIKVGEKRVNIQPLVPTDATEPAISGGYLFKKDRLDPGDVGFATTYGGRLAYVDPKEKEITVAQRAWLSNWFKRFETALYGADYRNPTNGYAAYIDVRSFVDQWWIVEVPKNIDGFRLSNYMHKDRLGKLAMDPIWDWNLSFGNADYADGWLTTGWYSSLVGGTDYPWFPRLVQDPDFRQAQTDRWGELRKDILATPVLLARIDQLAAFLNEAQVRNYQKWLILGTKVWPNWYVGKTYQDEINWMKQWTSNRLAWIDGTIIPAPVFTSSGGPITPGFTLGMSVAKGSIRYTLDGSDPRTPGGSLNPKNLTYSAPITLSSNVIVTARSLYGSSWSPPTVATFVQGTPPLVITEIMYHPDGPGPGNPYTEEDLEFVELKNAGATTLNLTGVHFSNGIEFSFSGSAITNLAPGAYVLVVKNMAAFASWYGPLPCIAGEYVGSLENAGEKLTLAAPLDIPIQEVTYNDTWYPTTDGKGFSLVVADQAATLSSPAHWRASTFKGGSPGRADLPPLVKPIWISEVLVNSTAQPPFIELYNPNTSSVDVSFWYLTADRKAPRGYQLPNLSIIQPGKTLAIYQTTWAAQTPAPWPGSRGGEVYLYSADGGGDLTGYSTGLSFGDAEPEVSIGRHVTSTPEVRYPARLSPTPAAPESAIRVGPVVINELRYHPALVDEEFIELKNLTDSPVKLYDPLAPTNGWKMKGAGFMFPPGAEIPANGLVLLSGSPTATARLKYNIPPEVPVFALFPGVVQNGGETLALQRPGTPELDPATGSVYVPYYDVDVVGYDDKAPWPVAADGLGPALQRLRPSEYGDDPANWRASYDGGTPGRENWEPLETWKARYFSAAELSDPAISGDDADPDGDGQTNLQEYLAGMNPRDASSCFRVTDVSASGSPQRVTVTFPGVTGRGYTIQMRDPLATGAWLSLSNAPSPLANGPMSVNVPTPTGRPSTSYRVATPWVPKP